MIPNPGSPEAKAQGCRCPVIDNARGRGAGTMPDGRPVFVWTTECPLHGTGDWLDEPTPTITCPRCGAKSAHPVDIAEGYCGECKDFTSGPKAEERDRLLRELNEGTGFAMPGEAS